MIDTKHSIYEGLMMRKLKLYSLAFVLAVSLALPTALAQRRAGKPRATTAAALMAARSVDTISAEQLKNYLYFIASDEMEGRDTPSRGLDTTAKFLAMNLSRWGFKTAGDESTYFQRIALRRDLVDKTQTRVQLSGQTLTLGDDYIPLPRAGDVSGQLVFAGNGWLIKSKNIDAYKGVDPKGKIAVIFSPPDELPRGLNRADLAGKRGEDWMAPAEYAQKQGAVGIVTIPDFQYLANWDRNRQRLTERGMTIVEKFQTQAGPQPPAIVVAPKLANALFQGERQNATSIFEAAFGGGEMPGPFALSPEKQMTITVVNKTDPVSTQNVVAIFEGSDPVLKDEYVALGAHYDHIGIGIPVN